MDLEAEIERADLIAEALRSHQRLEAIEAEYHAKLHEYCAKVRADISNEYAGMLRAALTDAEGLRRLVAQISVSHHKRGQRMLRMQKKLRAKSAELRDARAIRPAPA